MVVSYSRRQRSKRIDPHNLNLLSENQREILVFIAINGPIDAYRTNRDLGFRTSTTQFTFEKFCEDGLIQLKETVRGETGQLRNLHCLTPYGFCLVTISILKVDGAGFSLNYDELKQFITQNENFFPELLKNWDFFIDKSREYYNQHPVQDWKGLSWLKPLPDISIEIWCAVLLKVCHGLIEDYSWREWRDDNNIKFRKISEDDFNEEFKVCLVECLTGYFTSPHLEGLIFSLKQNKELCANLIPGLSNWMNQYEKQMKRIKQIIDEIK